MTAALRGIAPLPRVAVVGSGISGLAAAYRLAPHVDVTLFEAADRPGGHTNTVDVTLDGHEHGVDTGFLVFNRRTYPNLIALFDELHVPMAASDMSLSVSVGPHDFEWCGSSFGTLFAQPANAVRPRFWRMLGEIVRFNRLATALALDPAGTDGISLGDWLDAGRWSTMFREGYLVPMAAAIWSCPIETMLQFPAASFVRFCHNHGLLQVTDRPQWYTVKGGARQYVRRMLGALGDVRLATPVRSVKRPAEGGVLVRTDHGTERFDHLVLASHSDQSLALLDDPTPDERAVLGAIPYQRNRALLHTDAALMPKRRRAWAAWNYLSRSSLGRAREDRAVSVTYWSNRLQPLPFQTDVFVSLNPLTEPDAARTLAEIDYAHPVFDQGAIAAQRRLPAIQGVRDTWFAGAWSGWGFHEDGLSSGLAVAADIVTRLPALRPETALPMLDTVPAAAGLQAGAATGTFG